jgi:hypothetical protein
MFCGNLVYFPPFWYILPRKIWQPCPVLSLFWREKKISGVGRIALHFEAVKIRPLPETAYYVGMFKSYKFISLSF